MTISRRSALAAIAGSTAKLTRAARPKGYLVENTIHTFSDDQERFPYHPLATYRPPPLTVESYGKFAMEAKIDHAVIVQSEVYQDDHRYLEHSFAHEPRRGFFKGTCLFDPIDPRTPGRIRELVKRHGGRIAGIRIHEFRGPGEPATATGPIRDRDLKSEGMKNTWRTMGDLGLIVQMQTVPHHAAQIGELAGAFGSVPVLIDHLAFPARGTPAEYEEVIRLARRRNVTMKVSTLTEKDKPLVRRLYDAYGPERLIWGSYGKSIPEFEKALALAAHIFDYATEGEREQIRGGNAMKLFRLPR